MKDMIVNCTVENSLLDNITNILTLAVSIINLCFIVWIYFKDIKDKKISKEKDYKYDWFKMITVHDRIENLNYLIDDIKQKSANIFSSKEDSMNKRSKLMKESLDCINNKFYSEKNSFTCLLNCIDENSNIEMSNLYNLFQEAYIEIFTKAVANQEYSTEKLTDISAKISTKYYEIGIDLIK